MIYRIGVFTYLSPRGADNLGDSYGYQLVSRELSKRLSCAVQPILPTWEGYHFHLEDFDLVTSGCGTLLSHASDRTVRSLAQAQDAGTPTAIFGSGMSDESHIVPTAEGSELFDRVRTQVLLGSWVRGREAPCLFWVVDWYRSEDRSSARIGLNLGAAAFSAYPIPDLVGRLQRLAVELRLRGYQIVPVLACTETDAAFTSRCVADGESLDAILIDGSDSSRAALSNLRALISFRGHLGVFAAASGVQVFQIPFSSKIYDMYAGTKVGVKFLDFDRDWVEVVCAGLETPAVDNEQAVRDAAAQVRQRFDMICQVICSTR